MPRAATGLPSGGVGGSRQVESPRRDSPVRLAPCIRMHALSGKPTLWNVEYVTASGRHHLVGDHRHLAFATAIVAAGACARIHQIPLWVDP